MNQDTTYVAVDDRKRNLVVGILRPGAREPELRDIPNEPRLVRRLFERLKREGPVRAPVQNLLLPPGHHDPLVRLTMPDHHVEVTTRDQIHAGTQAGDPVQDLVQGPHVALPACRAVNAEQPKRPAG